MVAADHFQLLLPDISDLRARIVCTSAITTNLHLPSDHLILDPHLPTSIDYVEYLSFHTTNPRLEQPTISPLPEICWSLHLHTSAC